jgi:hypothetical protein
MFFLDPRSFPRSGTALSLKTHSLLAPPYYFPSDFPFLPRRLASFQEMIPSSHPSGLKMQRPACTRQRFLERPLPMHAKEHLSSKNQLPGRNYSLFPARIFWASILIYNSQCTVTLPTRIHYSPACMRWFPFIADHLNGNRYWARDVPTNYASTGWSYTLILALPF